GRTPSLFSAPAALARQQDFLKSLAPWQALDDVDQSIRIGNKFGRRPEASNIERQDERILRMSRATFGPQLRCENRCAAQKPGHDFEHERQAGPFWTAQRKRNGSRFGIARRRPVLRYGPAVGNCLAGSTGQREPPECRNAGCHVENERVAAGRNADREW